MNGKVRGYWNSTDASLWGYGKKDECSGCSDCDCKTEESEVPHRFSSVIEGTGHIDIDEFIRECLETMRIKGHDYRQGNDDDLLHNFRTVAETVNEPMMKVWFTYFYKHYSALATFVKEGGQQESEPIESRIKDMIVYLILFYRMVEENKNKTA